MVTFTSTMSGASADYVRYVRGAMVKTDRYKDSTFLDFQLAPIDNLFMKLTRGAYIVVDSVKYPNWFTGYITNEPDLEFLGTNNNNVPVYGYRYKATSDDFILSQKPIGILPALLNVSAGAIIRQLAEFLNPGLFDTTEVDDGPIIAQYIIEPDKKFIDIVQDLSEAAAFRFSAKNHALYFKPQDEATGIVSINGADQHFTPARLQLSPAADNQIVNDVIVLGDVEPQGYVHEYFVGTGFNASFPLISSVFGSDTSVLLDESFSGSAINGNVWDVFDVPSTFLSISDGYLNCVGGSNNGSYDVKVITKSPIPMEGRLRLTHGEWDFTAASNGVIAGLWTQSPNASFTGCLYGLRVNGTTINPIVNGSVDSSQSFTVDTSGLKRYVFRTIAEFSKDNRSEQEYAFVDSSGTRGTYGGSVEDDRVIWDTVITEIDVLTGNVASTQVVFRNEANLVGTATAFAQYAPIASNDLHATVTGITISVPVSASLQNAEIVPFENLSFENWIDGAPVGWPEAQGAFEETTYAHSGSALKLQADGTGAALVGQSAVGLIQPDKTYTVALQLRKTIPTTTGTIRIYLAGTAFDSGGLTVNISSIPTTGYTLFRGTLTTDIASLPTDLVLYIELAGADASVGAVYVDDVIILSEWQQQIVGPNEVDSIDSLAPIATIVGGNIGADTKSSLFGKSQYQRGQSELVFFRDSVLRTTTIPPQNQLIRLSYRSAGTAIGRSLSYQSIQTESANWGDTGYRSSVRSDLSPRPRNSHECELAAAAIVAENAYTHFEGTYTQYSPYFTNEPVSGGIVVFSNMVYVTNNIQSEEIHEVVTTLDSLKSEIFIHEIKFGKPDKVRRLLSKFSSTKGAYQRSQDLPAISAVNYSAAGITFAPDVTRPEVIGWDSSFIYMDAGQDLAANGLYFEVRYTDDGWGIDDGRNLITRTSSRYFTVPRSTRGRVFFVKQAIAGNRIQWSENQSVGSVYSGATATQIKDINPDGNLGEITSVNLIGSTTFIGQVPGLSGTQFCWSFSIKGPAGLQVNATFGTSQKIFTCSGYWQRISVSYTGTPPTTVRLTAVSNATVQLTRYSVEQGTLVETAYVKTTGSLYGPVSRYPTVVHVSFPAPQTLSDVDISSLVLVKTY